MAAPNLRSNTLQLSPNVPVDLVLKYQTGREVANGRIMFTTHCDQRLFLDPQDARKIHELGLEPYEPLRIVKRVVGSGRNAEICIVVSRVEERQPARSDLENTTPAAAATAPSRRVESGTSQSQPQNSSLSDVLARCYISAIDALILAKQYADSKGVTFRITEEEIRCSANSIFIEVGRMKDRSMRYGSTQ